MSQKTTRHRKIKDSERRRYFFDAREWILGRLASQAAQFLMGKHRVEYSPQWDQGDYVVVVNTQKVRVSGRKEKNKLYFRHTGYPGGIKEERLEEVRKKDSNRLIRLAVRRMLPKNRLGREMLKKLYLFTGEKHSLIDKEKDFIRVETRNG